MRRHKDHEWVEEGFVKKVIPATLNSDSSSSSGVVDTKISPPKKENRMPPLLDLNLPAPTQEDDEHESCRSLTLCLGLKYLNSSVGTKD
jgi:hypothetical protein